jgi:hypothetical protein
MFMFVYGILIETRVFGELIPMIVCASILIVEDLLVERMSATIQSRTSGRSVKVIEVREAA